MGFARVRNKKRAAHVLDLEPRFLWGVEAQEAGEGAGGELEGAIWRIVQVAHRQTVTAKLFGRAWRHAPPLAYVEERHGDERQASH